ncbi:hypothetical protein CDAR_10151 [Caerostris darwini]|uniref:Uncharacterized protein n=1 Tax=Caerostris darwini TaxID=1538125 RepID=A0AAV4RGH6_9ARAC|nr:hypothetical protein CDAR_10151 [Caerostris darwini]
MEKGFLILKCTLNSSHLFDIVGQSQRRFESQEIENIICSSLTFKEEKVGGVHKASNRIPAIAKHGKKNNITLTAETHGFPLPAKTGERPFPSTVWDRRSITSEAHNRSGTESTWNFGSPDPGVGFDGRWGRNWETKTPSTLCFEMT